MCQIGKYLLAFSSVKTINSVKLPRKNNIYGSITRTTSFLKFNFQKSTSMTSQPKDQFTRMRRIPALIQKMCYFYKLPGCSIFRLLLLYLGMKELCRATFNHEWSTPKIYCSKTRPKTLRWCTSWSAVLFEWFYLWFIWFVSFWPVDLFFLSSNSQMMVGWMSGSMKYITKNVTDWLTEKSFDFSQWYFLTFPLYASQRLSCIFRSIFLSFLFTFPLSDRSNSSF